MTLHVPAVEKMAELQVRKWEQNQERNNRLIRGIGKKRVGSYLALSRETGARGSETARTIAERMEWDLLDQEIIDYMEERYGTPRYLLKRVDEKHENWLSSLLTAQIGGLGFSETTYTRRVAVLLMMAASHGGVVIVGRGARFILPKEKGVSVRIVGDMDFRVDQVVQQQGLSRKDAHRFIVQTDHDRDVYIKSHFHHDANDPHLYDIVLNVTNLSVDEAADAIVDSLGHWMQKGGLK